MFLPVQCKDLRAWAVGEGLKTGSRTGNTTSRHKTKRSLLVKDTDSSRPNCQQRSHFSPSDLSPHEFRVNFGASRKNTFANILYRFTTSTLNYQESGTLSLEAI